MTPASAPLAGLLERIERIASEAVSDPCAAAMEREVLALWEGARRTEQRRSLRAVLEALGSKVSSADLDLVMSPRFDPAFRPFEAARLFLGSSESHFLVLAGGYGIGKTLGVVGALAELAKPAIRAWADEVERRIALGGFDLARSPSKNLEGLTQPGRPIERIGRMGFEWWPADELATKWEPWRDERASGKRAGNRNAAILVIDDLGAELADDRTVAAFERVVEHRVDLKTIITTNASPAVLRARYGARVGERIGHHGGMLITFDGPSRRRAAAW